ncbi:MAG: hypothetical protein HC821_05585 [Lewinella sp.]|nr:hypothetical protein [Lewinella sp.]
MLEAFLWVAHAGDSRMVVRESGTNTPGSSRTSGPKLHLGLAIQLLLNSQGGDNFRFKPAKT